MLSISIHALREEGDFWCMGDQTDTAISIHALREEGDIAVDRSFARQGISIHALREEGDPSDLQAPGHPLYFYPRPPRGGRRKGHAGMDCLDLFLSTPSARRATHWGLLRCKSR